MIINVNVKLLSLNGGPPSVKTVIDTKEVRPDKTLKGLLNFVSKDQQAILNKFNGGTENYDPYELIDGLLIMPRFMFQHISDYFDEQHVEHVVNHRSHVPLAKHAAVFGCKFGKLKIDIFPDKIAVIDQILLRLQTHHGLIVKLDTGKGKSIIISELARRLGLKSAIITKDKTLQKQMAKELHDSFHLDESEDCEDCISKSGGSYCRHIAFLGGTKTKSNTDLLKSGNYKILVAVINSARLKPQEFWKPFGITFFDECQTCTPEKFSNIFETCQTHYTVGLSATPDEKWNSIMLEHNIGKIIDFDPQVKGSGPVKGRVYKIIYNGPPEHTRRMVNTKGIISVAKMVEQFMHDPGRNKLIVDILVDAVAKYKHGFVFAMRNDFLRILKQLLDDECIAKGITINSVVLCADSTNDEREIAYTTANVVFTNYAFGTGVNIVQARFEVHASPYKNGGKQITGRVLRKDLTDERYFYDIIDNRTQLRDQFTSRELIYNARGLIIENYPMTS
jgi:superfamily II DNA or RNA helicase